MHSPWVRSCPVQCTHLHTDHYQSCRCPPKVSHQVSTQPGMCCFNMTCNFMRGPVAGPGGGGGGALHRQQLKQPAAQHAAAASRECCPLCPLSPSMAFCPLKTTAFCPLKTVCTVAGLSGSRCLRRAPRCQPATPGSWCEGPGRDAGQCVEHPTVVLSHELRDGLM